jgi:hypothetical protein
MLVTVEAPRESVPVFDFGLLDASLRDLLLAPFEPFEQSMAGHGMDVAGARRHLAEQSRLWTVGSPRGPLCLVVVDRDQVDEEGWDITVIPMGVEPGRFIAQHLSAVLPQDA